MNRQISRVALASLLLLGALIVATTYWQTWASAGLADAPGQRDPAGGAVRDQARQDLRLRRQDGARRRTSARRSRARRSTSAPTRRTGSRRRRSATRPRAGPAPGSSRAQNSYLTGVEHEPGHDARHARRPGEGQRRSRATTSSLTLNVRAQQVAESLLQGKCGAAVVLNPKTGAVYVMAASPELQPEPDRAAERLREDPGDEEPVRTRAGRAAPQPRHAGPLPAGLDVQDDHRRGRARRRRLHARTRPSTTPATAPSTARRSRTRSTRTGPRRSGTSTSSRPTSTRSTRSSATSARSSGRGGSSTRRRSSASTRCPRSRRRATSGPPRACTTRRQAVRSDDLGRLLAGRPGPPRVRPGDDARDAAADGARRRRRSPTAASR